MDATLLLAPPAPLLTGLLDPAAWAAATYGDAALGDARRTRRAVATAAALAAAPAASLPAALRAPPALKAAYRLLHEADVTAAALTAPERARALAAARAEPVVLLLQDTTEVDYTHHPATAGLGPTGDGGGRGYLLQSVLAVAPEGRRVLGLAHLEPFLRAPAPRRGERCSQRRGRPRESDVWARAAAALGPPPPGATWVHVGDRGADVFAFLAACRGAGADVLVRAAQDRRAEAADGTATRVLDAARALPAAAARELGLPARPGRPARTARVAVAWAPLTVRPPADVRGAEPLPAWVVRVWEPAPPPGGEEPLEWVLLTSVPTATVEDAWARADWYAQRWLVEEYHRALKTGCRLEASQLRDKDALWRLLGLRAPAAVRLLQLRQAARADPARPAAAVVGREVAAVVAAAARAPAAGMTAGACWRLVARLGGHQGRARDGEPGWQTLWRGWLYVQTLLEGVHLALHLPDDGCG
jgi:hypothetical protein